MRNPAGTIAGQLSATPYLRFLDGRIVRPFPGDAPYTIVSANGINDAGQIAATGRLTSGGPIVALVLTPRAPPAPQTFTFSVAGRTVTLGWQPSVGAIDYILEAGTAPGLSNAFNGNVGAVAGLSVGPTRPVLRARPRAKRRRDQSAIE